MNRESGTMKFCILASSLDNQNKMEKLFAQAMTGLSLAGIFNTGTNFSNEDLIIPAVDFLAMDEQALFAMEENKTIAGIPVILFSAKKTDTNNFKNLIIETISLNEETIKLKHEINKLRRLKTFFEMAGAGEEVSNRKINKTITTLLVKKGKEFQPLDIETIPAFFHDNKITFIYDSSGKKMMFPFPLVELENLLGDTLFFRVNRRYLVNRKFISSIRQVDNNRYEILMRAGENLSIEINQQQFAKLKRWIVGQRVDLLI